MAKYLQRERQGPFSLRLHHAIELLIRVHCSVDVAPTSIPPARKCNLDRAVQLLLHITPALLQSLDARGSRQARYSGYWVGRFNSLVEWLALYVTNAMGGSEELTDELRCRLAAELTHQRGGKSKAASALLNI